jgi:hypothetical protein
MKMEILNQSTVTNEQTAKMVIIAGFIGGILSMSFVDGMNKKQRAIAVFSGAVMAHYLAPLISYIFAHNSYEETIGFLIGLFGVSITASIFKAIQESDLWALVREKALGKKDRYEDEGL